MAFEKLGFGLWQANRVEIGRFRKLVETVARKDADRKNSAKLNWLRLADTLDN